MGVQTLGGCCVFDDGEWFGWEWFGCGNWNARNTKEKQKKRRNARQHRGLLKSERLEMILLSRRCCYCVFVFAFLLGSFLHYTRKRSNGNRKIDAKKTRSEGSSGEKDEREKKSGSSKCWGGGSNRYGTKKAEGCRKWEAIGCCFSKALQRALSHVQIGAFVCLAASMERHTHAEHSVVAI